jgi:hypothetical protein
MSKSCPGCPFDFCSEDSERAQNYGCLPSPYEILTDMKKTGKNWACHDNPKKICRGLASFIKDENKSELNNHRLERKKIVPKKIDFSKSLLLWDGVHY